MASPRLFFVCGLNTVGASMRNAPVESEYLVAGLKTAGAIIVEEPEFALYAHRDKKVVSTDKVVGFFNSTENAKLLFSAVAPYNRWTYMIDTKVRSDGTGAYDGRIEYCQQHQINHAVVTYINAMHLHKLAAAGISHIGMPHCAPERRKRRMKTQGILVSGALSDEVYPTRTRLFKLLGAKMTDVTSSLISQRPVVGTAYYDVLDTYHMGIVCRGGERDCLVAKYVEFGACHVLPVGDCPTYMPTEMKRPMVNVEGMTDEQVVTELRRLLLNPVELTTRQDAYREATHRHFDRDSHSHRIVQSILST